MMAADMKWPGRTLQRAVWAGLEIEGHPEFLPDYLSTHRRMQVARLMRTHRLNGRRALFLAAMVFGEEREPTRKPSHRRWAGAVMAAMALPSALRMTIGGHPRSALMIAGVARCWRSATPAAPLPKLPLR